MIDIRPTTSGDIDAVRALHKDAFPDSESDSVAALAVALVERSDELSLLSLVAVLENDIIGHVVFSPVGFADDPGWQCALLAPLAVSTRHHGAGVGTRLVKAGLRMLEDTGVRACLVYGDPAYYGRFGFGVADAELFLPPHPLELPHGWQARLAGRERIDSPTRIIVVEPLDKPELW